MNGSAPIASARSRTRPLGLQWLDGLTSLSLDPILAMLPWQGLFAFCFDRSMAWTHSLVLAGALWMGYSADRWIDAHARLPPVNQGPRHAFSRRFRWPILGGWVVVFALSLTLSIRSFSAEVLIGGTILALTALAYTLFARRLAHMRAAKGGLVGGLVGASVGILFLPLSPQEWTAIALLMTTCAVNATGVLYQENQYSTRYLVIPSAGCALFLILLGADQVWWLTVGFSLLAQAAVIQFCKSAPESQYRFTADLFLAIPPTTALLLILAV